MPSSPGKEIYIVFSYFFSLSVSQQNRENVFFCIESRQQHEREKTPEGSSFHGSDTGIQPIALWLAEPCRARKRRLTLFRRRRRDDPSTGANFVCRAGLSVVGRGAAG